MNSDKTNPRLAVLIDADNTFSIIEKMEALFEEISQYGDASVRRIYGDWTDHRLNRWKEHLPQHAIQPIQQYANTRGKNATDSALIIDAMDLLYTAPLEGFCIISSDSDFTRLAIRLREAGKLVYGFGEAKTPNSLIKACNKFIYVEILSQQAEEPEDQSVEAGIHATEPQLIPAAPGKVPTPGVKKTSKELASDARLVSNARSAIMAISDEDGFAHLGEVKKQMVKNFPAFDSRNYGYSKFSELIKAIGLFEVDAQKQRIKDKRKK
ncbi:Uncharacterized conserved protein, LabA/DUF88 family [Methylophilus rhizosphaerae]|uniref:Uncharacterized conserved protein, LabA/DUF88 family n=1 Tax=Methylophilus rhizosphaerae TaxID=492660 RepID=A0A1G9BBL0_9PROT|nr:NYN domain-containing protein [Methylophilus rhizosphaerae]SDK36255.1 Uncharacterized conserved protein, LabA/DUF88 family [Methylophilus rhizosphaerae]